MRSGLARVQVKGHNDVISVATLVVLLLPMSEESTQEFEVNTILLSTVRPGGMICIWYGLTGMAWYMVWSSGHGMVYGVVWWAWHGIWYSLMSIVLYMHRPGERWHGICYTLVGYGMLYGMACRA